MESKDTFLLIRYWFLIDPVNGEILLRLENVCDKAYVFLISTIVGHLEERYDAAYQQPFEVQCNDPVAH
jgi:hypothetical protein